MELPVTITTPKGTLTITTDREWKGLASALEIGYYTVREEYADGSGQASVEQDTVARIQQIIGIY